MLRCWMMVLVLFSALAAPASAAELTGFGSIKFGMTKEEAWEAIGGKGEWMEDVGLTYETEVDWGKIKLKVHQFFMDGKAAHVGIGYTSMEDTIGSCRLKELTISGLVKEKYKLDPFVIYGEIIPFGSGHAYEITDIAMFSFERGAYIEIEMYYVKSVSNKTTCNIDLFYSPPSSENYPF